ncbi:hypothetical protein ZIOFF_022865 [Zingiber officinale]|uniref:Uncharacterized protein n=1 Tax=Zingiber officinale TaxID=94328 RepID=A0A8J5HDE3_ZINOF|nr:hypothetical protein ZIOFF_022865 [Zingiber officinale]
MGSSRKKGSGRAAAAAASSSQRQWKVGDLVLAKMRGFPAWPAVISEPESWGFSAVSKKLFVYFYGTKQVAFCNCTDVETFTEEKKKTLLLKRQGKGADFVRALDEIIDVYETSKKQNADQSISGDDEDESCGEDINCVRTTSNSSNFNDSLEFHSHIASNCELESACNLIENTNRINFEEISANSTADDSQKNVQIQKLSILDQIRQDPLVTSSSRKKRLKDSSHKSSLLPKVVPTLKRSRSSLLADSSKALESSSVSDSDLSGTFVPDTSQNDNPENNNKHGLSHSASSNGCCMEVAADVALKHEFNKFTRGIVDSDCHLDASTDQYLDNKERSNKNDKFCLKSPVNKKRKTDREKATENSETKKNDLPVVLSSSSPNLFVEMKEIIGTGDGDEHLPLVKRARVRMGKPLEVGRQHGELVGNDENLHTSKVNKFDGGDMPSSSGNDDDLNGAFVKEELNNSSINNNSPTRTNHIFWTTKYHLNVSSLDVEAALPPSKRLHRALEAMSANTAQSMNDFPESSKATKSTASLDVCETKATMAFNFSSDAKIAIPEMLQSTHASDCHVHATNESTLPLQNIIKSPLASKVESCEICPEIVSDPHTDCDEIVGDLDKCDGTMSKFTVVTTEKKSPQAYSLKFIEDEVRVSSTKDMSDKVCFHLNNSNKDLKGNKEGRGIVRMNEVNRDDTSDSNMHKDGSLLTAQEGLHPFRHDEAVSIVSATDVVSMTSSASVATRASSFQSDEDCQTGNMHCSSKETSNGRCSSPDLTPMKELIAAAQFKRTLSHCTSFTHNYLDSKLIPDTVVSPSLVHKQDSPGQGIPCNGLADHKLTVDDGIHALQNDGRGPHVSIRLKGTNKSIRPEASAARKTFEALLWTLSRTKESIGRATRLAIDCAKYGMAREVIELILQYLEREQSLHKRVDLFFLVDSITQCSHIQKGGASDVYPSLVQSVLPRLLSFAAPRGNAASENRRQCLKARTSGFFVLRLWFERKTLPESVVRYHMRELDSANEFPFGSSSRRPLKTERAINDPIRDMEGMLVDEYGSNTNFQLPCLLRANVLEDDGNTSDEKSFEAVTPEGSAPIDQKAHASSEKNRHVLEDVDVELEMEDVSPPCEDSINSTCPVASAADFNSHHQANHQYPLPFAPPLPDAKPPSPPPLPSSPPPVSSCSDGHGLASQCHLRSQSLNDAADLHSTGNALNMQSQQPHLFTQQHTNQHDSLMPKPASYYAPNYGSTPGQMPPPTVSASYGTTTHPFVHSQNSLQPSVSTTLTDTVYHVQPPPPTVSNHFSYVQAEPQQRPQMCGNYPLPERYQYIQDNIHRGNFHSDQATGRQFQNEIVARSNFSPATQSGTVFICGSSVYGNIETPSASLPHYGHPPEPPPIACSGWSRPPMSNFSAPTSRLPEVPAPRMEGGIGDSRIPS